MLTTQLISLLSKVPFFTKQNLGVALEKEGEDLNYWIKKLTREQFLLPLKKGFYSSKPYQDGFIRDPEQSELYWLYIANTLRSPSYVSLEYMLSKYNIIPESATAITSVTLKSSRTYAAEKVTFIYRSLKIDYFFGYRLLVLGTTGLTVRFAYPFKALFDFLYLKAFNSTAEMREYLLETGRIQWDVLDAQEKTKLKKALADSQSAKLKQIGNILQREGIL